MLETTLGCKVGGAARARHHDEHELAGLDQRDRAVLEVTGKLITADAAASASGAARGRASLDSWPFRARCGRATRGEHNLLPALAEDGDAGSSSNEIAFRSRRSPANLGPSRASLIGRGVIYKHPSTAWLHSPCRAGRIYPASAPVAISTKNSAALATLGGKSSLGVMA